MSEVLFFVRGKKAIKIRKSTIGDYSQVECKFSKGFVIFKRQALLLQIISQIFLIRLHIKGIDHLAEN